MDKTPFYIPDTSPIFTYSPCTNCGEGGWQSAYSPKGDGFDQTFHQTPTVLNGGISSSSNLTVGFNISCTSLTLSTGAGGCDLEYSVNGSGYLPACGENGLGGLPGGMHRFLVRPKVGGVVQFFGIDGEVEIPKGRYTNITLDNTSPSFTYSISDWAILGPNGTIGTAANVSAVESYQDRGNFYNGSLGVSTVVGGRVDLSFNATVVYLYGMSGPLSGSAQVTLDGEVMSTLNLSNPWNAYSSLLFMQSNLDTSTTHNLSVESLVAGKHLVIDYALLTVPAPPSSSGPNLTAIIGIISGTSAILLIFGVSLYFYISRHRQQRRQRQIQPRTPYGFDGISHKDAGSKASSIDFWRNGASEVQLVTPQTIVSGSSMTYLPTPRTKDSFRSPPPEYPDYLPYTGPFEDPPTLVEESEPPLIAGANLSAQSWLAAQRYSSSSNISDTNRSRDSLATTIYRHLQRPPATYSRDSRDLDEFYRYHQGDMDNMQSPMSIDSAYVEHNSMTARAVGATRSVARLWPTRGAVPSAFLHPDSNVATSHGTANHPNLKSTTLVSNSKSQLATLGLSNLAEPPPTHSLHSDSVSNSNSLFPLRRGVSIKSVKTMRSFFSSLFANPTSPLPSTPAYLQPAARPDSGIFPLQLSLSRNPSTARGQMNMLGLNLSDGRARTVEGRGRGSGESPNLFIELNPNSPITGYSHSRPSSWRGYG